MHETVDNDFLVTSGGRFANDFREWRSHGNECYTILLKAIIDRSFRHYRLGQSFLT